MPEETKLTKVRTINPKFAKAILVLILLAIVSFGLYTFVMKASVVVQRAYDTSNF